MDIVVVGLSITSSWGNGHATIYRGLLAALARRGHRIQFLERDVPWYASNRDLTSADYADVVLYDSVDEIAACFAGQIARADLVIVGSYVPDGVQAIDLVLQRARGVTAFYDIDTPVTMAMLATGNEEFVAARQLSRFDLYLSLSGGPVLDCLERQFGVRRARPFYCSIDPDAHRPEPQPERWHLGYLGTYSPDRAAGVNMRLIESARQWPDGRFVVAGAQFPDGDTWPANVDHYEHLPPADHRRFFGAQRFTLNVTREAMVRAGYSPSVRLFEAAACGVPIISDPWPGLESFFVPGEDILVSRSTSETLDYLVNFPDVDRTELAARARARVLSAHTAAHRAAELEHYAAEI